MGDLHNDGDYRGHISITYQEITPGAVNTPRNDFGGFFVDDFCAGNFCVSACDRRGATAAAKPTPPANTPTPAHRRQTREHTGTRATSSTRPAGKVTTRPAPPARKAQEYQTPAAREILNALAPAIDWPRARVGSASAAVALCGFGSAKFF